LVESGVVASKSRPVFLAKNFASGSEMPEIDLFLAIMGTARLLVISAKNKQVALPGYEM